jgi:hypothetical protein
LLDINEKFARVPINGKILVMKISFFWGPGILRKFARLYMWHPKQQCFIGILLKLPIRLIFQSRRLNKPNKYKSYDDISTALSSFT